MALVLTVWYRENFDLLSPLCDRSFTRVGKFSRQIKMMECRIISFFPLTFRTRSFLSSSFSFLFYNNTRLGINVKLSWPNRKMPRFVLTNGILTNATKGTISRSFRATFPSLPLSLVIRFGLALRLSLQLSTCLGFTIRVLLADVRDLSTKLSVGVHGRS